MSMSINQHFSPSRLLQFALPSIIMMMFMSLYTIVDGIFISRFIGSNALSSLNIVFPVICIVTAIGTMLATGGNAIISKYLGEGKRREAKECLTMFVVVGVAVSIVVLIFTHLFLTPVCYFLGSNEVLLADCEKYLATAISFAPACMLQSLFQSYLVTAEKPHLGLFLTIGAGILNAFLDYFLIAVCRLGMTGAALATALAQAVGGLMVLVYLFGFSRTLHLYRLKISMKSLHLTCRNTGYMIQLGASAMLGELAIACMMLVGNYAFIRMLKEDGVAAYSVACYCLPIVFMIANAIAQSAQPIISYNYGTGNAARVHETFRLSLKTAFISGLTAFAVMYVFCPYIVAMFLEPGCPAYGIATKGIPYFASGFICFALNIAWIGYYQSIELARKAMLFMLLRGIILMSICFLALPHLLGEKGLWAAVPCAELIIFIALTIDYQYRHKICRVVE